MGCPFVLKQLSLFCLLLSSATSAVLADDGQEAPPPDPATDAEAILVTATRLPLSLDRVPESITLLDKAAIDRNQDIGVSELLLRTPGVSIHRNGGYGSSTSLRIRGAESDQTVVVIDGVKLNDPSSTGGGFNFSNLLIGDAARIEVLRGPQSILWGSQAIGGVVNIVTPLPKAPLEGSFDLEAGSRETASARAALGGKQGRLTWRVGAQAFTTDGISAFASSFGGRERDGYRNRNLSGRAELEISETISADLRGYYSRGRNEFDAVGADNPAYGTNREFVGYAGLNVDMFDKRLRNRFAYGYTDTDRDNYDPRNQRTKTFDAAGRNQRFEYQGSFAITEQDILLVGVENERSRFRSVSPPAALSTPVPAPVRGKSEITGIYGQLSLQPVTGLTLNAGMRHDDHARFGSKTLFSAGGIVNLPTGTRIRASYGEGFKAPTLYQLYSEYGNDALAPERAHGWEAGAEQRLFDNKLQIGAVWFDRTSRDLIVYIGCASSSNTLLCFQPGTSIRRLGYYQNVSRAKARGLEAQASLNPLAGLSIDANYSWTMAEDRSPGSANFGKWLPRRPRQQANGSISYAWPLGLTTGVAVRWSGHSYDNASNSQRLDDYMLVDLRAELALSDQVRLFARAENLFDEGYMTAYRYGALGRSIYAGVRGRF